MTLTRPILWPPFTVKAYYIILVPPSASACGKLAKIHSSISREDSAMQHSTSLAREKWGKCLLIIRADLETLIRVIYGLSSQMVKELNVWLLSKN